MPALEISINCLCLFVPGKGGDVVHVLMPHTDHGHHRHRVMAAHAGAPNGILMEGWLLRLGGNGPFETSLKPKETPHGKDEIVDMWELTPEIPLRGEFIQNEKHPEIVSRVDLRAGYVQRIKAEATWKLNHREIAMAAEVVWCIDDIAPEQLTWTRTGSGNPAPPFQLADLTTGNGFHLLLHHATTFPPSPFGTLNPAEVREHFKMFYALFGITNPADHQLPRDPKRIGGNAAFVRELARAAREDRDPGAVERLIGIAERVERAGRNAASVQDLARAARDEGDPDAIERLIDIAERVEMAEREGKIAYARAVELLKSDTVNCPTARARL